MPGKDIPEKKRFSACQIGFLKLNYCKTQKESRTMKQTFLYFILFSFILLLTGCSLFREQGPAPVTPPFTLPRSDGQKTLTPELLTEKMTDKLSMGIVTKNLAGLGIQSIPAASIKNGEMRLLAAAAVKLASTGLIHFTNSPRAPHFKSRLTPKGWQVTLETPFPKKILLQEEILFR